MVVLAWESFRGRGPAVLTSKTRMRRLAMAAKKKAAKKKAGKKKK